MSEPTDALRQYLSPGRLLNDRYQIEQEQDAGSFGAIYRARDLDTGRECAIKALPPMGEGHADETSVGRFEREMRVIEQLDHPSLVELFDYERTESGIAYMVLEYIEGRDLDAWLDDEGAMSLDGGLTVTHQLVEGLGVAHGEGVIHRDLKPGNIMVVSTAMGHRAKLLDFGMAKLLDTLGDHTIVDLTREGTAVGTPRYIAPEQAKGSDEIGPATDLYALGLLMYELLTGDKAVQSDTIEGALRRHLTPEPISMPNLEALPDAIGDLIRHMTRKDHDARLQSASRVSQRLEAMAETPMAADASTESDALFGPPLGADDFDTPDQSAPSESSPSGTNADSPSSPDAPETPSRPSPSPSSPPDLPDDVSPSSPRDDTSSSSLQNDAAESEHASETNTSSGTSHSPERDASSPDSKPPPPFEASPDDEDSLEVDWDHYEQSESITRSPDVDPNPGRSRHVSRGTSGMMLVVVALPFALAIAFMTISAQCAGWHPIFRSIMGLAPVWVGLVGSRFDQGEREARFVRVALVASVAGIFAAHLVGVTALARQLWENPVWFLAPVEDVPVIGALADGIAWISRQYAMLLGSWFGGGGELGTLP